MSDVKLFARNLTGASLRRKISAGADAALLPVGSTELHGPQLPLGTDSFISEAVALLAARKSNATIFDPVNYSWSGMTRYSRPTISIPMELECNFVRAVVEELRRCGFRKVALIQFHGPGIALTKLTREIFEETGFPVAFFGLMRMPSCGRELCAARGVAWEASLAAAAAGLLGIEAEFDDATEFADAPQFIGGAGRDKVIKAGGVTGALGSDDLHHGLFREPVSVDTGREILQDMADAIAGALDGLGEFEAAWRNRNLLQSWGSDEQKH
ncbi:MAG: creatininase family protein [Victivallaceae bacterium]